MIRVALIGGGQSTPQHLRALQDALEVQPATVVEARGISRLLADGGFDGVLVAAEPARHAELVAACAAARVPVLCEAPLGTRLTDAVEATRAASDAGIVLQVGFWQRFVAELRDLQAAIEAGEFGAVQRLACAQLRQDRLALHELDLVRWLAGQEIASLSRTAQTAIIAQLSRGATAAISLASPSASPASSAPSLASPSASLASPTAGWVEIVGSGGYATAAFPASAHAALVAQVESFAAAIDGEPREGAGGDDANAALAVAELIDTAEA